MMRFFRFTVRTFFSGAGHFTALAAGFLCLCTLFQPAAVGRAEVVDRIVAIVNDEVISLYELDQAIQPYVEQVRSSRYAPDVERQLIFEVRGKILNEMINEKLADQELKRQKISVAEKEVDNAIERIKESRALTDEELRSALTAQGLTYDEFRRQTRQQILRARLANREVRSKIVITEQDIQAYYDQNKEQYAGEKKYHLRNVFIRVAAYASDADRQAVRNKLEAARAQLSAGRPLAEVARTAPGPGAPIESDDLGFFKLEDLSPQLKEMIGKMRAGEVTPVLDAPFGFQVLMVEEIAATAGKTPAEAAKEIEDKLFNQIVDQKYQSWVQDLRDRAHIKIIN